MGGAWVFSRCAPALQGSPKAWPTGFVVLRRRFSSQRTVAAAALVLMAMVWLPAHFLPLARGPPDAAQFKTRRLHAARHPHRETTPPSCGWRSRRRATPSFAQRPHRGDLLAATTGTFAKPRRPASFSRPATTVGLRVQPRRAQLGTSSSRRSTSRRPTRSTWRASAFETLPNGMRLTRQRAGSSHGPHKAATWSTGDTPASKDASRESRSRSRSVSVTMASVMVLASARSLRRVRGAPLTKVVSQPPTESRGLPSRPTRTRAPHDVHLDETDGERLLDSGSVSSSVSRRPCRGR